MVHSVSSIQIQSIAFVSSVVIDVDDELVTVVCIYLVEWGDSFPTGVAVICGRCRGWRPLGAAPVAVNGRRKALFGYFVVVVVISVVRRVLFTLCSRSKRFFLFFFSLVILRETRRLVIGYSTLSISNVFELHMNGLRLIDAIGCLCGVLQCVDEIRHCSVVLAPCDEDECSWEWMHHTVYNGTTRRQV